MYDLLVGRRRLKVETILCAETISWLFIELHGIVFFLSKYYYKGKFYYSNTLIVKQVRQLEYL